MALAPDTQLAQYRILKAIGKGGMGEVYRALDTNLGREVAIKILPEHIADNPNALHRFKNEARALAALSHPNILAIHDFCKEKGIAFAVMELLEGETLRKYASQKRLSWQKATEIAISIGLGLAAAHSKGIVHRDLKPENIFLTSDGSVKILDFGLAKIIQEIGAIQQSDASTKAKDTVPGTIMGTIQYMSPEQIRGESIDTRTDIFALGCVLYEMLAGTAPFLRKNVGEIIAAILNEDPPSLNESQSEIPPSLISIVERSILKNPAKRFQSAHDLVFVLNSILDNKINKKFEKNKLALFSTGFRYKSWIAMGVALLLASLVGLWMYNIPSRWHLPSIRQKVDPEAQQAYLKGRHLLDRFDGQAYVFFEQATIKNPEFANAYAGLADSCVLISIWDNFSFEQREVYIKAKESALKALELDEFSAEAHTSLANVYFFYEWDFHKAEKEWFRAFKINNGYRLAHETYAFYLAAIGRFEEAWQQMDMILKNDTLSAKANAEAGFILYLQKNFNESIKYYKKAYELDPGYMWGRDKLIEIYIMQGQHKEAFEEEVKQLRLRNDIPPNEINEAARSFKTSGIYEIFRSEVEKLLWYTPPQSFSLACDYAMLNEKEKAIEWLQRMYKDRHGGLVFIKVDPVFEKLDDNPDYQDIIRHLNFPK